MLDDFDQCQESSTKDYFNDVNRGGLTVPTELAFQTSVQCWRFYNQLNNNKDLNQLLHSPNVSAQRVFQYAFVKYLDSCDAGQIFFTHHTCENGHEFRSQVFSMAGKFFNLFSKNFVSVINSDIHSKKSRKSDDGKRDPLHIKVAKLQSQQL